METFTPAQLAQIEAAVRQAVKEELSDAGLRVDDSNHQDEAREDFRFLRRMRRALDGASVQTGRALIVALLAIFGTIVSMGFWQWISRS